MPYTRKGGALPAVFNTRDEELHKKIKSPIAPLFSLSNTLPLEIFVDKTLAIMIEQIDKRFVDSQAVFDLSDWLQYFAFDVMGTLTFSKRYGFLEQGRDMNSMLRTIWEFMKRASPVGASELTLYLTTFYETDIHIRIIIDDPDPLV